MLTSTIIDKTAVRKDFSCPNCGSTETLWDKYKGDDVPSHAVIEAETWIIDGHKKYTVARVDICEVCGTMYAYRIDIDEEDPEVEEGHIKYMRQQAKKLQDALEKSDNEPDGE